MKQEDNSNTNRRATGRSLTRAAILALLNWSEMDYNQFQWEQGRAYLEHYLPKNEFHEDNVQLMEYSALFWAWWKNHWAMRDELFLNANHRAEIFSIEEGRTLYAQHNSGSMLAQNIHPNSVVLNDTYDKMISELVKTETPATV